MCSRTWGCSRVSQFLCDRGKSGCSSKITRSETVFFRPGCVSLRDSLCGVAPSPYPSPTGGGNTITLSQRERVAKGRVRGLHAIPRQPCQDKKIPVSIIEEKYE